MLEVTCDAITVAWPLAYGCWRPRSAGRRQDSGCARPTKAREELQALTKELDAARNAFFEERNEWAKKLAATQDEAERKDLLQKLQAWQERFATEMPIK